jgi:hypothetical protein
MKFELHFPDYSEEALDQIVDQASGKPFLDRSLPADEQELGTIVSARRVGTKNVVMFEVQLHSKDFKINEPSDGVFSMYSQKGPFKGGETEL